MFEACSNVLCRNNAVNSSRMKRYGEKCLNQICEKQDQVSENVGWILNNSVNDPNYRVSRLNDTELKYCLSKEARKTGQAKLLREKRRREDSKRSPTPLQWRRS
ncbi:MAG: hypothetical protein H6Q70_134 [Firmicutes bacterium]|nr:hypothetical protein [Ignavibacteriaceae bacterium]MBP2629506.1 hypothetical protein [Bacillota bacterium]